MRTALVKSLAAMVAGGATLFSAAAALAAPTTYVFDQTSSSVAGFDPVASITINGGFSNLPTLSNIPNPGPYNFGNLLGLSFSYGNTSYTLADFTPISLMTGRPEWNISPSGITFIQNSNDFEFAFSSSPSVTFHTDAQTSCYPNGCTANGAWDPVPEPSSLALLLAGFSLVGAAYHFGRKKPVLAA